jgi:hypothetical protein
MIAKEEAGRRPKSNVQLKSAFHLQARHKQLCKLNVQSADKSMQCEHRGVSRDTKVSALASLTIQNTSHHLEMSPGATAEEA